MTSKEKEHGGERGQEINVYDRLSTKETAYTEQKGEALEDEKAQELPNRDDHTERIDCRKIS